MLYTVRWLAGDTVVAEDRFKSLEVAKSSARDHLAIYRDRHGATTAEVRDLDGILYYRAF